MVRVLLTGGAGYIGSHVALCCLEAGQDVTVLDNFSNSSPAAIARIEQLVRRRVRVYRGDVQDGALLRQILTDNSIDTVMHFAGLKAVGESAIKPLDYYRVNVGGSLVLAQAMMDAGVFRLIFSSTASVYGNQLHMPVTENSELGQPASPYGRSKLMVEQALTDLCFADPRWSIALLRYFNPVGAHPSGRIGEHARGEPANLVPYAMQVASGRRARLAVFGDDYPTPDGTGVRDYIHVMDLAEGHISAMQYLATNAGRHVWNLGVGRGYSVLEVIREIEAVTAKPLAYGIAQRRPGDTAECWADPSRAHRDLGWLANRGLREMLTDHWRWQSQNPRGYEN